MKKRPVEFVFLYHPHLYDVNPGAQLGLGLLLLATYAKSLGASVHVINAQSLSTIQAVDLIPSCRYLMMYGCLIDKQIIAEVATFARKKAKFICVGGPIAVTAHREGIKGVDWIIQGYGEDFTSMLINANDGGFRSWDTLDYDINYYPFPDRSLINGGYGENIFKRNECDVSTTLLTSRGCKYKCAFCTSGCEVFFQEYSLDRIEKELDSCLRLGIRNIRINDDNLMSDKIRLTKLCALFKRAGVRWRASVRVFPNYLDEYLMMKEAGCEELSFGIESGDPKILRLLNKGTSRMQNATAISNARKAGIFSRALMMMGTPGETTDTLGLNIGWVERAKPDVVSLKMFVPYPGTEIYDNPYKYRCDIHLPLPDVNNSAYRPDNSEPCANIDSQKLYQEELTHQFLEMRDYLETKGLANHG